MTLKQLQYLLAIVDSGLNITAAAERLYTSQPGISKQLKLLEEELALQLFDRKGKALVGVTNAGHDVIARARRIVREADSIKSLAGTLSAEEEGLLSIATTHTQARYVLPEVVSTFRQRYPKVKLELHQGTSEQIAELVAANKVDLAIATGSQHLFPDLVLLPCYHWHRIVLVPKEHPLAQRQEALTLATLAEHPLVTYVFSLTGESSFKAAFRDRGLEPEVVFTARDADVIKTYVRLGLGVGVVAAMAFECEDDQYLTPLDARGLFPRLTTWLGFPRNAVVTGYMAEFIGLLAPHLSPRLVRTAAAAASQNEVDALFEDVRLPVRGGCENRLQPAA
jgi:LysR family cys regulon transcriptional activator